MCGESSNCLINNTNEIFQHYSSKIVNMDRILQSLSWIQHIYELFFIVEQKIKRQLNKKSLKYK
jgi:hypothetical protein